MSSYLKLDTSLETSLSVANASFPSIVSDASIAVWCRLSTKSISVTLFQKYDGSNGYEAKFNEEVNGDLSLEFIVDGSTTVTSRIENVPVKLDEWQLFVFQIDTSGNQGIYIDSVLHSDTQSVGPSPAGSLSPAVDFYMGIDTLDPSITQLGTIDIDGFSFYNSYLLSETEIRSIYNKGEGRKLLQTTPNLSFGFNFDEGEGSLVTDIKTGTALGTIISDASTVDDVWGTTGGVDVMRPSYIKLYLTSLEPDMKQMNYSQSLGGYIAYSDLKPEINSPLYPETTLNATLGLYQTDATLNDATDILGSTHIAMINEIAEVEEIDSTSVTIIDRGVNGTIGYYTVGTIVQGVKEIFNDSFNTERKQYRCYAVKNISTTESAYEVSSYFKQLSRNINTTMRLALEYPRSQGITGISTSWTSSMLTDSSIAGVYEDNLFSDSYLTFEDFPNAGLRIRILSYDGTTGTFVFADSISPDFDPLKYSPNINYTVDASPAQRVKTGIEAPLNTDYVSEFSTAIDLNHAVTLISLDSSGVMYPGDIIYVWIEREIGKSESSYSDNSFVLTIDYEKEQEGN